MSRLFGFGDSYTQGHHLDPTYPVYTKWREYREDKRLPDTWFDLLSKKLNFEGKNYAVAGMSNDEIKSTIISKVSEFKKGDIVIINWTYSHRFKWASYQKDNFGNIVIDPLTNRPLVFWKRLGVTITDHDKYYISEKTQLEIAENKTHELHVDEIYEFEDMLDYFSYCVGFKVFYWSAEPNIINNLDIDRKNKKKYILTDKTNTTEDFFSIIKKNGGMNIGEETNQTINDMHFGESGHRVQFELIYNQISEFL